MVDFAHSQVMNSKRTKLLQLFFCLLVNLLTFERAASPQQAVARSPLATTPAASSQPSEPVAVSQPEPLGSEPLIVGGDLLKVRVFGVNDFDEETRVSSQGKISLPLIGEVKLAGLTTEQAQTLIAQRLIRGNFMLHPQVLVFEKEAVTQGISVMGEVSRPGVYPLLGARPIFDVLSLAGGTTEKSGPTVTITHKDRPNDPVEVNITDAKTAGVNREVLPGDKVLVSRAGIVYVVGDVKNPSGVVIASGSEMTVLKAIAMVGGVSPTAAVNRAKLIRRSSSGPEEKPIALKRIFEAKAPDLKLQAEDIVFIPSSAAKSASKRGLEAILQAATGVAIYRTP
jgi:polysaccharide biosynthesis/export protein